MSSCKSCHITHICIWMIKSCQSSANKLQSSLVLCSMGLCRFTTQTWLMLQILVFILVCFDCIFIAYLDRSLELEYVLNSHIDDKYNLAPWIEDWPVWHVLLLKLIKFSLWTYIIWDSKELYGHAFDLILVGKICIFFLPSWVGN